MIKKFKIGQCVIHKATRLIMVVVGYGEKTIISVGNSQAKKIKVFSGQIKCEKVPYDGTTIILPQDDFEPCIS